MSKIDPRLFSAHEHALEQEYECCPKCGAALTHRHGKAGPFLGCSNYPQCDFIRPLHGGPLTQKVLEQSPCPECGAPLALKQGRYGLFIGCTRFPECQHHQQMEPPSATGVPCPACGEGHLIERKSRYGKRFFACDHYPTCRYAVNDKPVSQPCPECGWPIMVARAKGDAEVALCCPQKQCRYKLKSV